MLQRLQSGKPFLWVDEAPGRLDGVRNGGVLIAPARVHTPIRVPDGLIHDWLGAIFLPGTTIDDVTETLRDYERYTEYYRPTVANANRVDKGNGEDRFSLVLLNRSLFLKKALSGDYRSSYFRVDARRQYSVSQTTGVREIEDYGEPDQRVLSAGEGSGYIWRLYGISRFEERDGGVYVEVEAIALSRDIPFSVRWLVDPIVRRVARSALLTSLQQTRAAVSTMAAATRSERKTATSPPPCNTLAACTGGSAIRAFH
jgi:hypothetical protein